MAMAKKPNGAPDMAPTAPATTGGSLGESPADASLALTVYQREALALAQERHRARRVLHGGRRIPAAKKTAVKVALEEREAKVAAAKAAYEAAVGE